MATWTFRLRLEPGVQQTLSFMVRIPSVGKGAKAEMPKGRSSVRLRHRDEAVRKAVTLASGSTVRESPAFVDASLSSEFSWLSTYRSKSIINASAHMTEEDL